MLRYGTIIIAFILISLVPIGYSLWFYKINFHFTNFGSFIFPTIITLLPAMLFVFGLGTIGGRYHQGIIFVLMVVMILINYVSLPYAVDLFGGNFYSNYPVSLDIVEPAFSLPKNVLIGKLVYVLVGIMMILISIISKKQNKC
ncbi:hypothetical protein UT300005_07550 [Clostridium sp. CTA-5]